MTTKVMSVLELMKNTPLVRLRGAQTDAAGALLWGKLELAMPGQMKDRVALKCVADAEERGELKPGGVIVESSSGTFAEGLARVGTVKGYRVIIVTDPRLDAASEAKLKALGAEVVIVGPDTYEETGGWQLARLRRLKSLLKQHPGAFWPRQYDTPSNPGAYSESLAHELLEALGDRIAAVVGSVGSGGSLCGTAAGLQRSIPGVMIIAVDAVGSVQFNQPERKRLQSGHGNSIVPGNIKYTLIDEVHWLNDTEAFWGCRQLSRREGVFAGGSSGAVYVCASWVATQFPADTHVVAILPDRGDRYVETIYSDVFLARHNIHLDEFSPPSGPTLIRYGVDVADSWSRAPLPKDGDSCSYFCSSAGTSSDISRALDLP